MNWEPVKTLDAPGFVGETTLRFLDTGEMMALVRRENMSKNGSIGVSAPPFTDWTWSEIDYRLGGPNFIQTEEGHLWAGSRYYFAPSRTVLATMTREAYTPVLLFPSGGDTSYPGMVMHEGLLWFVYYASHEDRTSIYLAKVALPEDGQPRAPRYTEVPGAQYLRTWMLCGPFPAGEAASEVEELNHFTQFETDWLKNNGGEAGGQPVPGEVVTFEDQRRNWLIYTSEDDTVDLDLAVTREDPAVAYAYAEVESAQEQACLLSIGSNDGVRVWLNGKQVHDFSGARGLQPDTDVVPIVLKEGVNRLLLKVEERGGAWGFTCRILPAADEALRQRLSLFQIVPSADAPPTLHLLHNADMLREFLQQVRLRVLDPADATLVHWEGAWDGAAEMALPLAEDVRGEQILEVTLVLSNGHEVTQRVPFLASEPEPHVLFAEGQSDYQILLSEDASDSERWAAEELQKALAQIGGVQVNIGAATGEVPENAILVGWSPRVAALLGAEAEAPAAGDESFTYRNFGPTLAIWGGRDRGTMYGVIDFLERELGCRWYTPSVSVMPTRATYAFSSLNFRDAPLLRVRNNFYFEAFDPIWAAHNRSNGAMGTREQPGGVEAYWAVHTFFPLVPPEEFFAEHPEYFSLINGERIYERAQLCLTNPEVLDILTERLRKVMREQPNYLIYSVSQNDWRNPCQCENCQEIARREESEAGPVLWFVNEVAARVKDEFPDKFVGTLAYQYTRKPPKTIVPADNVVIRFCSIECCFAHDFLTCPQNVSFMDDLLGWSKIAPRMYVWDYVVNFNHYIQPYPNFGVLASNLKTFVEHHAIGVMEQAAYQSRGGEFAELRAYVLSKLLWNYNADVDAVINDFMYGYYGRSGQFVRQYFDLLHNRVTPDTHIHLGLQPEDKLFSEGFVREALAIFAEAEKVADNEDVLHRVEMASLPVLYLKCKRTPLEAKHDGTYAKFNRIVEREGITHYAEAGEPHREAFHAAMDAIP